MEEIKKEVYWQNGGFLPECLDKLCNMADNMLQKAKKEVRHE